MEKACAVQIVKLNNHKFDLDLEHLKKILQNPKIKDRKVVVVSVAGAFRKGKSFLLAFFLRFLYACYVRNDIKDWLEDGGDLRKGFSWKNGPDRDTTGILMWSDVFTLDRKNDKIAIIVLDTQGVYDNQSTVRDCSFIFALSTLISSVQVYNLSQNIQETDLHHLSLFTDYAKYVLKTSSDYTPFQTIQFLIRDWSFNKSHAYGAVGGQQYLDKCLKMSEHEAEELKSVRKFIKKSFSKLKCYLMPHPGLTVAGEDFNGTLEEISDAFKNHVKDFVPSLLAPENLIVKEINGEEVTVKDLVHFFEAYVKVLGSDEIPKPSAIMTATAEAHHKIVLEKALNFYLKEMGMIINGKNIIREKQFAEKHDEISKQAIILFETTTKLESGKELSTKFKKNLLEKIQEQFQVFNHRNNSKLSEFEARMEAKNLKAIEECTSSYTTHMDDLFYDNNSMTTFALERNHSVIKNKLISKFLKLKNDQDLKFDQYKAQLEESINNIFLAFIAKNEDRIKIETKEKEAEEARRKAQEKEREMEEQRIFYEDEREMAKKRDEEMLKEFEKERELQRQKDKENQIKIENMLERESQLKEELARQKENERMRAIEEEKERLRQREQEIEREKLELKVEKQLLQAEEARKKEFEEKERKEEIKRQQREAKEERKRAEREAKEREKKEQERKDREEENVNFFIKIVKKVFDV